MKSSATAELIQGGYGLSLSGLPPVEELVPGPVRDGPRVRIEVTPEVGDSPPPRPLDADGGIRRLADGRLLRLDRASGTALFFGPPLTSDLLAHPYLGPVATAFNRWAGREAFHAGAFVSAGRAWAILGPRTTGKSTLLAALAARGVPVLADDIVISDGAVVYRGPRCVDLREPPAGLPGLDLRPVRLASRLRLRLPVAPAQVPLGGWFFLSFEDSGPRTVGVPASRLLGELARRRAWRHLDSDPALLLSLATLPAWELRRPRRWDAVPATLDLLDHTTRAAVSALTVPSGPR